MSATTFSVGDLPSDSSGLYKTNFLPLTVLSVREPRERYKLSYIEFALDLSIVS